MADNADCSHHQSNNQAVSFFFFNRAKKVIVALSSLCGDSTFALSVPACCRPAAVKQLYTHLLLVLDFIYNICSGDMLDKHLKLM